MSSSHVKDHPHSDASDRGVSAARNSSHAVAEKINQIIADTFTLYLKTKNFHWHVSGPHFRDYHVMLDEQAADVLATIDPLAERVRALGGATVRSVGQVTRLRTLKDNEDEAMAPEAMLRELLGDTQTVIALMRDAHRLCTESDDVATSSLLEGYIDAAEKRAWFLREVVGLR